MRCVPLLSSLVFSLASSALGAPSSPNDLFRSIAAHVQRPPDPPICCLRPLPSAEPEEEIILSFEDWKAKRQAQDPAGSQHATAPQPSQVGSESADSSASSAADNGTAADAVPQHVQPEIAVPPHARIPLSDRFNYASLDCSARIHSSHRQTKSAYNILSSKKDKYMLSPCDVSRNSNGGSNFVVVELCDDIRIDTIQLANYEFFSGVFKEFRVSFTKTYTGINDDWIDAGTYIAKNNRGVQSFHPPLLDFYRYVRIDFLSYYGSEYYCPVSLLRVYGLTHLEQYNWDEEQHRKIAVDMESESHREAQTKATEAIPSSSLVDQSAEAVTFSEGSPKPSTGLRETSSDATQVISSINTTDIVSSVSGPNTTSLVASTSSSEAAPVEGTSGKSDRSQIHVPSSNASPSISEHSTSSSLSHSDVSVSSETSSSSQPHSSDVEQSTGQSSVPSPASAAPSTSTSNSTPSLVPTVVPATIASHPTTYIGAGSGESIYRTIMTRISFLEANSTLYTRYVEEQTRSIRDVLRRLEEDVGRLEGIGKAQSQVYQRTILDWDKQRKRLDREHGELVIRLEELTNEVVLEKWLGIAQLCLLLVVLVFMAITRGSRGESFINHTSSLIGRRLAEDGNSLRRESFGKMREWGMRKLSVGAEWLRTGNSKESRSEQKPSSKKTPNGKYEFPRSPPSKEQGPSHTSISTQTPSHSHHEKPSSSRHRTSSLATSSRPRTPTTRHFAAHLPASSFSHQPHVSNRPFLMKRSSSHNASSLPVIYANPDGRDQGGSSSTIIGPVPRSARKMAKSSHLHELKSPSSKRRDQGTTVNADQDGTEEAFWAGSAQPSSDQKPDVSSSSSPVRSPLVSMDRNSLWNDANNTSPNRPSASSEDGPRWLDSANENEGWVDTDLEDSETGRDR